MTCPPADLHDLWFVDIAQFKDYMEHVDRGDVPCGEVPDHEGRQADTSGAGDGLKHHKSASTYNQYLSALTWLLKTQQYLVYGAKVCTRSGCLN